MAIGIFWSNFLSRTDFFKGIIINLASSRRPSEVQLNDKSAREIFKVRSFVGIASPTWQRQAAMVSITVSWRTSSKPTE